MKSFIFRVIGFGGLSTILLNALPEKSFASSCSATNLSACYSFHLADCDKDRASSTNRCKINVRSTPDFRSNAKNVRAVAAKSDSSPQSFVIKKIERATSGTSYAQVAYEDPKSGKIETGYVYLDNATLNGKIRPDGKAPWEHENYKPDAKQLHTDIALSAHSPTYDTHRAKFKELYGEELIAKQKFAKKQDKLSPPPMPVPKPAAVEVTKIKDIPDFGFREEKEAERLNNYWSKVRSQLSVEDQAKADAEVRALHSHLKDSKVDRLSSEAQSSYYQVLSKYMGKTDDYQDQAQAAAAYVPEEQRKFGGQFQAGHAIRSSAEESLAAIQKSDKMSDAEKKKAKEKIEKERDQALATLDKDGTVSAEAMDKYKASLAKISGEEVNVTSIPKSKRTYSAGDVQQAVSKHMRWLDEQGKAHGLSNEQIHEAKTFLRNKEIDVNSRATDGEISSQDFSVFQAQMDAEMDAYKQMTPVSREEKFLTAVQTDKASCGRFLYGLCAKKATGQSVKIGTENTPRTPAGHKIDYRLAVSEQTKSEACRLTDNFVLNRPEAEVQRPVGHAITQISQQLGDKCQVIKGDTKFGNFTFNGSSDKSGVQSGEQVQSYSAQEVGDFIGKSGLDVGEQGRDEGRKEPSSVAPQQQSI